MPLPSRIAPELFLTLEDRSRRGRVALTFPHRFDCQNPTIRGNLPLLLDLEATGRMFSSYQNGFLIRALNRYGPGCTALKGRFRTVELCGVCNRATLELDAIARRSKFGD
jgi:hypothetical protein